MWLDSYKGHSKVCKSTAKRERYIVESSRKASEALWALWVPTLQESAKHSGSSYDCFFSLFLGAVLYSITACIIGHWWYIQVLLLALEAGGVGGEDGDLQTFSHASFFLETSHSTGDHQPSIISLANKKYPWDCKELKSCMPGDRWDTSKLFLVNGQYHTSPKLSSFAAPLCEDEFWTSGIRGWKMSSEESEHKECFLLRSVLCYISIYSSSTSTLEFWYFRIGILVASWRYKPVREKVTWF